jgi:ferredoxin, 2Fe-2S
MTTVSVKTRDGQARSVEIRPGSSLMEALRKSGFDEISAVCGGCAACGTCHVYVDEACGVALPPMCPDESDMLANSTYRRGESRLSCQIHVDDSLHGLQITIAPEDE